MIIINHYLQATHVSLPPSLPCSIAAWVSTFKEIVDLRRTVTAFIARARR